jgi:hypothetical protein
MAAMGMGSRGGKHGQADARRHRGEVRSVHAPEAARTILNRLPWWTWGLRTVFSRCDSYTAIMSCMPAENPPMAAITNAQPGRSDNETAAITQVHAATNKQAIDPP